MGDSSINKNEKGSMPTKKWIETHITACQRAIDMNVGAINFCLSMIKDGIYCEEEKDIEIRS